jgi:hypothetical protein
LEGADKRQRWQTAFLLQVERDLVANGLAILRQRAPDVQLTGAPAPAALTVLLLAILLLTVLLLRRLWSLPMLLLLLLHWRRRQRRRAELSTSVVRLQVRGWLKCAVPIRLAASLLLQLLLLIVLLLSALLRAPTTTAAAIGARAPAPASSLRSGSLLLCFPPRLADLLLGIHRCGRAATGLVAVAGGAAKRRLAALARHVRMLLPLQLLLLALQLRLHCCQSTCHVV